MSDSNSAAYQRPQINISRPSAGRMGLVSVCAAAAVLQSAQSDGLNSLIIAFAVILPALLLEFLLNFRNEGKGIKDGSALTSALILCLLLPNHIHPLAAALGAAFAVIVVKYSFGGLGANWLNPALGGWLFVRLSWPLAFDQALAGSPLSSLKEALGRGFTDPQGPLSILKIGGFADNPLGERVTGILNSSIFALVGAELPGGYIDLLISGYPGIIADRGLFALLLGTILVAACAVSRFWIPLLYLAVYGILIRLFGALPYGGVIGNGDILFGLFSGGTMAVAFLMAADPTTGAKSNAGACICAVLAGLCSFMFRYQGGEAYGAVYSVAVVNALGPLIRAGERRLLYGTGRAK